MGRALMGRALIGPLGPYGPGSYDPRALMGWALTRRALMGTLGPYGPGPYGPPWPLWAGPLWAPWALMGPGPNGPQIYKGGEIFNLHPPLFTGL